MLHYLICSSLSCLSLCLYLSLSLPQGQDAISIFEESNWKACEEIALLEAVELYGLGNWNEIASLVGTSRSPDEVCDHFFTHYINGPIGRVARNLEARENVVRPKDHTCSKGDLLSPFLVKSLPVIPQLTVEEQQSLGYMPKRDDFEREFDNDAEKLISTLRIVQSEEDPLEMHLKLAHIDMYNRRLRERCRRKSIIREYALVSQFYQSLEMAEQKKTLTNGSVSSSSSLVSPCTNTDLPSSPLPPALPPHHASSSCKSDNNSLPTKRSNGCFVKTGVILYHRYEKQLYKKLRILSQLQSALDQKTLVDNLKREKELKARINDLYRLRKNGIKKVCEIASFEAARRRRRDKRKENKKKKVSLFGYLASLLGHSVIVYFDFSSLVENTAYDHRAHVTVDTSLTLSHRNILDRSRNLCSMEMVSTIAKKNLLT